MSFVSYHCHSLWSDGRTDVKAMVESAAATAGIAEFGLSDHFVLPPYTGTNAGGWSMPENGRRLEDCLDELRRTAAGAAIPVRFGVEADFFPETWEKTLHILASLGLDYVIGSIHYLDRFPVDSSADDWQPLTQTQIDAKYRLYWKRIRQLAESGGCDFIGHLDLPKKFGFYPLDDMTEHETSALDAIATAGVAVELNTSGWDKDCNDAYPSEKLLRQAHAHGIPVVLSADAHCPGEIARHYRRGADRLRACGYTTMQIYQGRQPRPVPIP